MNRRTVLAGMLVLSGMPTARAHTPYRQWAVYRRKHLLIGAHRADPPTYAVARRIVAVLGDHLPAAAARVARAPDARRLASLLGTDQLDVAVLERQDGLGMVAGAGGFAAFGRVPLRLLAVVDDRLLTAHERMPRRHAWLVAAALRDGGLGDGPEQGSSSAAPDIAWHPGVLRFHDGGAEPD